MSRKTPEQVIADAEILTGEGTALAVGRHAVEMLREHGYMIVHRHDWPGVYDDAAPSQYGATSAAAWANGYNRAIHDMLEGDDG